MNNAINSISNFHLCFPHGYKVHNATFASSISTFDVEDVCKRIYTLQTRCFGVLEMISLLRMQLTGFLLENSDRNLHQFKFQTNDFKRKPTSGYAM